MGLDKFVPLALVGYACVCASPRWYPVHAAVEGWRAAGPCVVDVFRGDEIASSVNAAQGHTGPNLAHTLFALFVAVVFSKFLSGIAPGIESDT